MDALSDLAADPFSAIKEDPPSPRRRAGSSATDITTTWTDTANPARMENWLSELEAAKREDRNQESSCEIQPGIRLFTGGDQFLKESGAGLLYPETDPGTRSVISPQELKKLEDQILGAEDKLYALEYELFCDVRLQGGTEVVRIQKTAKAVAALDVFASLAHCGSPKSLCPDRR